MKAVRIVEPRRIELEDAPIPEPDIGQVRLRVEGCGVCASNLGPWHGLSNLRYPLPPGESGHEVWGWVEALGKDTDSELLGQRVAALSQRGYAEYDVARAEHVVPLPSARTEAFPGEAFGCAMNIFRRAKIRPAQTVAIIGVGFLGAVLVRLAAWTGARVLAVSRRTFARRIATELGAETVLGLNDARAVTETVAEATRGRFCDRVVEAAGKQRTLDLAAELTAERGRLVVAGYHQDGPRQVNMQLWNWRGFDVINAHERDPASYVRGIEEAVRVVEAGILSPERLLTHVWPLSQLDRALDATATRPDGFLKATVRP